MSCFQTVPSLSILVLLAWSYYAYVVEFCIHTIEDISKRTIYLVVYHFFLYMFLWTYYKTLCADIAVVPNSYKIPRRIYEQIKLADTEENKNRYLLEFCQKAELKVITRTGEGFIRFCKKCKHVKPDRAHHCSKCGTCILKMDHHCPWVNNCISFSNYKYFVLFLCYNSLYCVFFAATTLEYFIKFFGEPGYNNLHVVVGFVLALSLAIVVLAFSTYHLSLISRNETTLEAINGTVFYNNSENLTFDVGISENFREVFGDSCCLWFIPVWTTPGDGLNFSCRLMF